jgi:hypothetical protein
LIKNIKNKNILISIMTSINGLRQISATSIQNSGEIYLGNNIDPGTAGQALVSGGPNEPARWDVHTGTINPLTMGTDLSLASGNATFDGSIPDTINAAGHGFGSGGAGIDISGSVITTDNDGTTINNSGGTGAQNQVLKVPNDLTFTGYATGTYNGSSALSINLVNTEYTAGNGMSLSGTTFSTDNDGFTIRNTGGQNEVLRVPNALTAGSNINFSSGTTFDGSSAITISSTDTNTQLALVADPGIVITSSGGLNRTIGARVDGTTIGFSGNDLTTIKVPNTLTFTGYDTGTFDGTSALSINLVDTDTTYQGGTGISIDTATTPDTINCSNIPNSALANSTISGISLGSNLATLTFYQADGTFITSYNGANPPTSITLDGNDQLTLIQGANIVISTPGGLNRNIALDDDLTGIDSITFTSTSGATALSGNNYPSNPTPMTNFDLSSTTNTIPGAVLATKIQRTTSIRTFTNVYSEYSSNFRTSFTAQSANVMVEFRAIVRADNRIFYGGLYDYNAGVYNTDTRNRFNYNDETDQDHSVLTWWMRNLTPGSTYYISPYFRGSSSSVYIYAGHSGATDGFAPGIMRIIDGGNNVNIY